MEKPYLLHMITPEKNISPFDANMAFDASWDSIIPYTNVTMEEIQALVQDTIFSDLLLQYLKEQQYLLAGETRILPWICLRKQKNIWFLLLKYLYSQIQVELSQLQLGWLQKQKKH